MDAVWLHAWQNQRLYNTAQSGGLQWGASDFTENSFAVDGALILTFLPGIYDLRYTVFVPPNISLNTKFLIQQSNTILPGTVVDAVHAAGTDSVVYTAQTVVRAEQLDTFRLSSRVVISYEGTGTPPPNLASIVLIRLGPLP